MFKINKIIVLLILKNYICIPLLRKIKDLLYETRIVIVEYNSLFSYLMNVFNRKKIEI